MSMWEGDFRYNFPLRKFLRWCFDDECLAYLNDKTITLKYNLPSKRKVQQLKTTFKDNEKILIDGVEYTIKIQLISSPTKQQNIFRQTSLC